MKNPDLFSEFDKPSDAAWKQKIQVALKGADYQSTLVWNSPEGIATKPFYTAEDYPELPAIEPPKDWTLTQGLGFYADEQPLSFRSLKILSEEGHQQGMEAFWVESFIPENKEELDQLLELPFPLYMRTEHWPQWALDSLTGPVQKQQNGVHFFHDPIGQLCTTGNWPSTLDKEWESLSKLAEQLHGEAFLGIDALPYANSGANATEQLSAILGHMQAYIEHPKLAGKITALRVRIGIGPNYFYEIAKLRALRTLVQQKWPELNIHLTATPALRNKTVYDYNVNLLRSCSECMAGILGGADLIYNAPYDVIYGNSNDFGHRIARNQLLLLKHESGLHAGFTDGSYYVEALTAQLVEKAHALWVRWEKEGGLLDALHTGRLQKRIRQSAEKEQGLFDQGELVLIGTNKYPNPDDQMAMYAATAFPAPRNEKTLIEPLPLRRLSASKEKARMQEEKTTSTS
ncbi:methylmalonyl-CoA mutase family protein [Aureicoccus marinus]|uniref:Methylmalonyl-CoA mutase alpha/beta chain catalytic domain-containing protein n=1 Tax=Aureicoccus marinus TaxID=754435 RepID=A0A2S7T5F2_9FLAO|nr:methylmalonyl-CoA mutase family protein [Aureicoccus marinus]PQJ14715.1 hypothetical protein BST99_02225 [Aureicoccus marinus]